MKVRLPVLVKDPEVARYKDVPLAEEFTLEGEEIFLDGPVGRRVAVLDFDPDTGALRSGARFVAPTSSKEPGRYELPRGFDLSDPSFVQAAAFGGVHKTLAMFEEEDALGRRMDWAFDGPQLLVVPRAGEWANAFYERSSRSLQLFFFTPEGRSQRVFTCHSQDILAHETAHAVIDGVVPDLYHALSPQSLAIHEAMADLATLLMAFRSRKLAARVLEMTGGSIEHSTAFTRIAEQFGEALSERRHALRDLRNLRTMRDPGLDLSEPHALSEVLSGALYEIMVRIHAELKGEGAADPAPSARLALRAEIEQWQGSDDPSVEAFRYGGGRAASAGRALWIGGERFKRTILRALDYLPPGEVSFADFGRAVLASDRASHPESGEQRAWLVEEFAKRGIVRQSSELDVETNFEHPAVARLDLDELARSDWVAYRFAERNRKLLGIPPGVAFEVRPRLDVRKSTYHRGEGKVATRELIFKVAWNETEPCDPALVGAGLPARRRFVRGTTLAIGWDDRTVRGLLTGESGEATRQSRDAFLARLIGDGRLRLGAEALAPDGLPLRGAIQGEVDGGALRVRSTARALHVLEER